MRSQKLQAAVGEHVLGGDSRAASKSVESDAFAEKEFADGATDGGAVGYWRDGGAFVDVPFDAVAKSSVRIMRLAAKWGQWRRTYVQSSCRKTSSKKGTPATIPLPPDQSTQSLSQELVYREDS